MNRPPDGARTRLALGRGIPSASGSQDAHGGDCLISVMPHCSSRRIVALLRVHPPFVRRLQVAPVSVNPDPPQTHPDERQPTTTVTPATTCVSSIRPLVIYRSTGRSGFIGPGWRPASNPSERRYGSYGSVVVGACSAPIPRVEDPAMFVPLRVAGPSGSRSSRPYHPMSGS